MTFVCPVVPSAPPRVRKLGLSSLFAVLLAGALPLGAAGPPVLERSLWRDLPAADAPDATLEKRAPFPPGSRFLALDLDGLRQRVAFAPPESEDPVLLKREGEVLVDLPLPEGGFLRFRVEELDLFAPEAATAFAGIRVYRVAGVERPQITGRLTLAPDGLRGVLDLPGRTLRLEPWEGDEAGQHVLFEESAAPPAAAGGCGVEEGGQDLAGLKARDFTLPPGGSVSRQYRLAIAVTGDLTEKLGGLEKTRAEITMLIGNVERIFRRELNIRFELQPLVLFEDPLNDPFFVDLECKPKKPLDPCRPRPVIPRKEINNVLLAESQLALEGVRTFDLGHLLHYLEPPSDGKEYTSGLASLGGACGRLLSGAGVTSYPSVEPEGRGQAERTLIHELGHQLGASHTFGCDHRERRQATSFEPGMGSTLMGYTDLDCGGSTSVATFSFHAASLGQFLDHANSHPLCGVRVKRQSAPLLSKAGPFLVPKETPFEVGQGTLSGFESYTWEQLDAGIWDPRHLAAGPVFLSASNFRSSERSFPPLHHLKLGIRNVRGETLPSSRRLLSLVLTGRTGNGSVAFSETEVQVTDDGPFRLIAPKAGAQWTSKRKTDVAWSVAGTDQAPIGCTTVSLSLLYEKPGTGVDVEVPVEAGLPNTGTARPRVPLLPESSQVRAWLRLRCDGKVFFDLSEPIEWLPPQANQAPRPRFSWSPAKLTEEKPVIFAGEAEDPDPDDEIVAWEWDFGDGGGGTASAVAGSRKGGVVGEPNPTHTFEQGGDYRVRLTVRDLEGAEGSVEKIVHVNARPVAAITASPLAGPAPLEVGLDVLGSYDPDGRIVHAFWSFGDGGPGQTGFQARHRYDRPGEYEVQLRVWDDEGASRGAKLTIEVRPGGEPWYLCDHPGSMVASDSQGAGIFFHRVGWQEEVWIAGVRYEHAIGMHPGVDAPNLDRGHAWADFAIPPGARQFRGIFGMARQDTQPGYGRAGGTVSIDGQIVWSGTLDGPMMLTLPAIEIPEGARTLRLATDSLGSRWSDHTTWADPRFTFDP